MFTSLCINKVVKTLNVLVLRNGMFSEPTGAINAPNSRTIKVATELV